MTRPTIKIGSWPGLMRAETAAADGEDRLRARLGGCPNYLGEKFAGSPGDLSADLSGKSKEFNGRTTTTVAQH